MFKDDYRKEIENISASEKFKNDTVSLMYEKQDQPAKTIKFARKNLGLTMSNEQVFVDSTQSQ